MSVVEDLLTPMTSSIPLAEELSGADALRLLVVVQQLSAARDLASVMAVIRSMGRPLIGSDGMAFVLRDGDSCFFAEEDSSEPLWKGRRFLASECISGWSMNHRDLVVIEDVFRDDRISAVEYRRTFVRSLAVAPIRRQRPMGAIEAYWATRRRPTRRELVLLQALADSTAVALTSAELLRERTEAEQDLRAMVENLPQLAWTARPDGYLDYFNRRWFEYTGTTLSQVEGRGWQSLHHPEYLPKAREGWNRSLATGEPFEMEFPLKGADGSYRWFLTRTMPIKRADGTIVRWIGTNTDIEEKRRQAVLLREALEARDTFLSVAAHELRTPLTSMALRLQALLRQAGIDAEGPLSRRVLAYGEIAQRQLRRLTTLVNALLDVSRIAAGRFQIERESLDLVAVVREVVERFEPQASRAGSPLIVDGPSELPASLDRLRVEQILTNLLDNALKYGPGRPVRIGVRGDARQVVLTVADEGIGIAAQDLARIFERFERAVSAQHYGGLGLGLYITRTLVQAMGGTIRANSEPGRGATFSVELPREAPAPANPE